MLLCVATFERSGQEVYRRKYKIVDVRTKMRGHISWKVQGLKKSQCACSARRFETAKKTLCIVEVYRSSASADIRMNFDIRIREY